MPSRKQNKWSGYASYMHISSDHFTNAKAQFGDPKVADKRLEELVHEGYSVSFSSKEFEGSKAVVCKFTGTYTENNRGLTMSSFASSKDSALALNLYKHFVLCKGGDWPTKEKASFG